MAGGELIFAIAVIIVMEALGLLYNRPKTMTEVFLSLLSWPFQLPSVVRRWWR